MLLVSVSKRCRATSETLRDSPSNIENAKARRVRIETLWAKRRMLRLIMLAYLRFSKGCWSDHSTRMAKTETSKPGFAAG